MWNAGNVQPPVADRLEHLTNLRGAQKQSLHCISRLTMHPGEYEQITDETLPGFLRLALAPVVDDVPDAHTLCAQPAARA